MVLGGGLWAEDPRSLQCLMQLRDRAEHGYRSEPNLHLAAPLTKVSIEEDDGP